MAFATQQNISEGNLTRRVEEQTSKVPSLGYMGLAIASMAASAGLAFLSRRKEFANFVGLWAPTFLIIGLYNKMVKFEHEGFKSRESGAGASASTNY